MHQQPFSQQPPTVNENSSIQDLDKAIAYLRNILQSIETTHPDRAHHLDDEGQIWYFRYRQTGEKSDIEQAVLAAQTAAQLVLPSDEYNHIVHGHLSSWLECMFTETKSHPHLEEALIHGRLALQCVSRGTDAWLVHHINLGRLLLKNLEKATSLERLEEAIDFHAKALELVQSGHKHASKYYDHLCMLYIQRHDHTSAVGDLEKAIEHGYQAVQMLQYSNGVENEFTNLASALLAHYKTTNLLGSLDEALRISKLGITKTGKSDQRRKASALNNYGNQLESRCERYRETDRPKAMEALKEAIESGLAALELLTDSDDLMPTLTNNIGAWYATGLNISGDLDWGERGVKILELAIELAPAGHSEYPTIVANLAHTYATQHQILSSRGQHLLALEALDKAIEYGYMAANSTHNNGRLEGERMKNLGVMLLRKHLATEDESAYREARKYLTLTAGVENAPALVRIPSAIQAGLFLWEDGDIAESHNLIQGALGLLSTLDPQSVSSQDLQQTLGQISGLATFAASIALEAGHPPYEALKPLEEARCVISGLAMSSNVDISGLRHGAPDLARKYDDIRSQLSRASASLKLPGTYREGRKHQRELLQNLSEVEADIRNLPGWGSFKKSMTEETMKGLAVEGPIIVVNATKIRCDAMVVTTGEIKLIRLQKMSYEALERNISVWNGIGNDARRNAVPRRKNILPATVSSAMLWLWETAVQPILDDIELTPSRRIWWITTGLAGRAPFHAAGDHSPGSRENTLSRAISSYVSSFKALKFARERVSTSIPSLNMLLVTMSSNQPPHHDLDTSHEEQVAFEVFGESMEHMSHPEPRAVLQKLPEFSVVHFACHGSIVGYDPFRSGLVLVKDDKTAMLTISDLEEIKLNGGAIAYLSACSTAEQADGKLKDEAVHISNAFQALGFQHVIGTMWGADDTAAGEVAKRFYKRLVSDPEKDATRATGLTVARALHEALIDYRHTGARKSITAWGPFIHVGA